MRSFTKVLLLLAAVVCISTAQLREGRRGCLCRRTRSKIPGKPSDVQDVQIYPVTIFCDTVEIIITLRDGQRHCLDPKKEQLAVLLADLVAKRRSSPTSSSTETSSLKSSTDSA
ncbi:interleukin-8-like [Myripristis murdjan]|uniref:interleukin-8-like n=1 Tax=Myripristis murdjan TaxID=586833 RepID=UPI001175EABC|nr:interleukin-8-like [Myripristis murdjan]